MSEPTVKLLSNIKVKKILIVGLGSIGRRHVQIIRELYPSVLIGVLRHKNCDDKESKALNIDICFTSMFDALSFQADAALVTNPAPMHIDVATELAHAGVHLLIEKPLAEESKEDIDDLIAFCHRKNLILMPAYNLRFLPSLIYFKEQLEKSVIGRLLSVRVEVGQYLPSWRPDMDYRQTVSSQYKLGGGVLLELSHEIDYLLWIFGAATWVKAHLSKQSDLEVDVEDTAHLQIGFKKDVAQHELIARLDMDFIRHDTARNCTVIGEKGTLRWDGITGTVEIFLKGGSQWKELFFDKPERNYTYEAELKNFISSIESNRKPSINAQDGLAVLQLIDAARESHNKSGLVLLDRECG